MPKKPTPKPPFINSGSLNFWALVGLIAYRDGWRPKKKARAGTRRGKK